jgi:hypothetical protein
MSCSCLFYSLTDFFENMKKLIYLIYKRSFINCDNIIYKWKCATIGYRPMQVSLISNSPNIILHYYPLKIQQQSLLGSKGTISKIKTQVSIFFQYILLKTQIYKFFVKVTYTQDVIKYQQKSSYFSHSFVSKRGTCNEHLPDLFRWTTRCCICDCPSSFFTGFEICST